MERPVKDRNAAESRSRGKKGGRYAEGPGEKKLNWDFNARESSKMTRSRSGATSVPEAVGEEES